MNKTYEYTCPRCRSVWLSKSFADYECRRCGFRATTRREH